MDKLLNTLNNIWVQNNDVAKTLELFEFQELEKFKIDELGVFNCGDYENLDSDAYFIQQPFGSQKPPDFLILLDGYKPMRLECKSSKTSKATWNCSLPESNTIYIFRAKNDVFIFYGDSIISKEVYDGLKLHHQTVCAIKPQYQSDDWQYYNRPMYVQKVSLSNKYDKKLLFNTVIKKLSLQKTNVEETNVEETNVEETNVEKTNVEKTNVEKLES